MYVPGVNRLNDLSVICDFMRVNSFAIVVSLHNEVPVATHLPITMVRNGDEIKLRGHFAKANPQWKTLVGQEVLVIFSGPHAYISPTHYDKHESVPTWNYVAVHAYGQVDIVHAEDQPERLEEMLKEMILAYETSYLAHWEGLDTRFRDGMKQGIVGFEIPVSQIQGKAKLSQNKNEAEQSRIADALMQSNNTEVIEVGYMMRHGFNLTSI